MCTVYHVRAVSSAGRAPALQAGGGRCEPVTAHVEAAQVSLLRWLRRQLRQPTPLREHLEAAVENDDPAEARRSSIGSSSPTRSAATSSSCSTRGSARPAAPGELPDRP